jgi:hypothetical protein
MLEKISTIINGTMVTIHIEQHGVGIAIEGYEPKVQDNGSIVYLDVPIDLPPKLYAWSDIDLEDPEFTVDLSKAAKRQVPLLTMDDIEAPERIDRNLVYIWRDFLPDDIKTNKDLHDRLLEDGVLDHIGYKRPASIVHLNYYFKTSHDAEEFIKRTNRWIEKNRK